MNRQISRLAILSLLLLSALIVATTYWQVWAAPGLAARQDNAIERVAQFRIRRGLIYASDGKTVLAKNIAKRVVALNGDFPPQKLIRGVEHISDLVLEQLKDVLDSYAQRDVAKAVAVWRGDDGG